jgi:phosphate starvation-inducible PhoH-like protein
MKGLLPFLSLFTLVSSFENIFLQPKNPAQVEFKKIFHTDESNIIINVGTAGTGKTLFTCQEAIINLLDKKMENIVVTRPCISVDNEQIGFLPGDLKEKMDPWMKPCMDYFKPFVQKNNVLLKKIEVCPIAYMRGRTFDNSVIIVEEAQNTTPIQMKLILTRIGKNSKIIINGDLTQSDIKTVNGLQDFMNKLSLHYKNEVELKEDGFHIIHYKSDFILRNPIIKKIDSIYN